MTQILALTCENKPETMPPWVRIVAEAGTTRLHTEGTTVNTILHSIFNEIDEMKIALSLELSDDNPNPKTILAIKHRLRSLDSAAAYRMVIR